MRVVREGEPEWALLRRGFASRFDENDEGPVAVVLPESAAEVPAAIRLARALGPEIRVRGAGHSFEAFSSRNARGAVLDLRSLRGVVIEGEFAHVEGGATMADAALALAKAGRSLPLATSPGVGVAGMALAGGFGVTSRLDGLLCDRLLSAELVLADGRTIVASETSHPELFRALRGAGGGNFGVVTRLAFRSEAEREATLILGAIPWERCEEAIAQYDAWAPETDDAVGSLLTLRADGIVGFLAQVTGKGAAEGMEALVRNPTVLRMPESAALRAIWELNLAGNPVRQRFKSTAALAEGPLPKETASLIRSALEAAPRLRSPASQPTMVQLIGGGGAPGRVPAAATAARRRSARMIVQLDAYWEEPGDEAASVAWADALRAALAPSAPGAYVGYHDAALAEPLRAYFGSDLAPLRAVKRQYDPDGVFAFPHGVSG